MSVNRGSDRAQVIEDPMNIKVREVIYLLNLVWVVTLKDEQLK